MKVCIVVVCVVVSMSWARAEPPVHQNLPRASSYATARKNSYLSGSAELTDTYGAPTNAYAYTASTYGAPASGHTFSYGTPASMHPSHFSTHGTPSIAHSSTYGTPANTRSSHASTHGTTSGAHTSQYSTYGTPASMHPSHFSTRGTPSIAHSSTYGTPANTHSSHASTHGTTSGAHSSQYSTYGTPASMHSALSSTYGRHFHSFSKGFGKPMHMSGAISHMRGAEAPTRMGTIFSTAPSSMHGASAIHYAVPSSTYGVPGYAKHRLAESDMAEPANYQFSYDVQDAQSGSEFGHLESRQGDAAWGSYNVLLPDGRKQIVEYEADQGGFRPMIRYEEPRAGYGYGRGAGGPY